MGIKYNIIIMKVFSNCRKYKENKEIKRPSKNKIIPLTYDNFNKITLKYNYLSLISNYEKTIIPVIITNDKNQIIYCNSK